MDVVVNGERHGEAMLVDVQDDGSVLIPEREFRALPSGFPFGVSVVVVDDSTFVRVASRPGLDLRVDPDDGRMEIDVAPWLLPENVVGGARLRDRPQSGLPAFFATYDAQGQVVSRATLAARVEVGVSAGRAALTSSFFGRTDDRGGRLDTTLRVDVPEVGAVASFGDAVSRSQGSGSAFRFFGAQWATDFATQPDLVPFNLPTARGVATVPSTIDLFVNGARVAQRDVPAGPFALRDLPLSTGRGELELRIRDAYGNERIVQESFLTAPSILRPGLTSFAIESGALRQDYSTRTDAYGPGFVAFELRRGISGNLTLAAGAQTSEALQGVRLGGATQLGRFAQIQAEAAQSRFLGETGSALTVEILFPLPGVDASARARRSSAEFRDIAQLGHREVVRSEWIGQLSTRLPGSVQASLSRVHRDGDSPYARARVMVLSLSRSRLWGGALSFQASQVDSRGSSPFFSLVFSRQDSAGRSHSDMLSRDAAGWAALAQIASPGVSGPGSTWDVTARAGAASLLSTHLAARTLRGDGDLELAVWDGRQAARVAWHGGFIVADGSSRLTSPLNGAAALIELPGLEAVTVRQDGQVIGTTDARGRLLATHLRPFEVNVIGLDAAELPLEGWVDTSELAVRPYSRGVLRVRFPDSGRGLTANLRRPDGSPVPTGARIVEPAGDYPVGDHGLISIPDDGDLRMIRVRWEGGECTAHIAPARAVEAVVCE